MNRVSHKKQDHEPPIQEAKKLLTQGVIRDAFQLGDDGRVHAASEFFVHDILGNIGQAFCQVPNQRIFPSRQIRADYRTHLLRGNACRAGYCFPRPSLP